jgi:hypothetical protein
MHLEDLLQALDMMLGLCQMSQKGGLKLLIRHLRDHLGKGLRDLLFGVVDVLQGMDKQVIECLDWLGQQTHDVSPVKVIAALNAAARCSPTGIDSLG